MVQEIYVISGGPSTGKTETIKEIRRRGYKVLQEAARKVVATDKRFIRKSIKQINIKDFQNAIFDFQLKQIKDLKKLKHTKHVFSDRGIGDTLAYYIVHNLKLPREKFDIAKKLRYKKIFILDSLDFYKQDTLRKETKKEQELIHDSIIKMYKRLGYKPVFVPFMGVKERADFILSRVKNLNPN